MKVNYFKDNTPTTGYTNMGINSRRSRSNKDTSVQEDFDPSINDYINYLKNKNLEDSRYFDLFKEFKATQIELTKVIYEKYLQFLIDTKKIENDRELYTHIVESLDDLLSNNLLHIDKKNDYIKVLNQILYSGNQKYATQDIKSKYIKLDYSQYKESNDFRDIYNNQLLNELFDRGGELYMSSNNKFYIKLSKNDNLVEKPKRTVESILSRIFGFQVQITEDSLDYKDIDIEDFIFKSPSYSVKDSILIGGYDGK
jgi:hypothetical protein